MINIALGRPVIDAVLFSLAVAVGITPQLLPAVVSTSLATGSRRLAAKKVLVKRLVCIEDLGDIDVLFTDKTGTLTDGRISFERAIDPTGDDSRDVLTLGLRVQRGDADRRHRGRRQPARRRAVGGARRATGPDRRLPAGGDRCPFDHERRCVSVLVERRRRTTRSSPRAPPRRCSDAARTSPTTRVTCSTPSSAPATASSPSPPATAPELTTLSRRDEHDLPSPGSSCSSTSRSRRPPRRSPRLAGLGITVKIVTGDNPLVAETVCRTLGVGSSGTLTGADLDALDDTPAHRRGRPGHRSSPGSAPSRRRGSCARSATPARRSRSSATASTTRSPCTTPTSASRSTRPTDVAKDAADIILLERDLDVLADGVAEGRRIFANTIKYVLMGTSSNFGNMFSVTVAAAFLPFLPMLPFQILLNNLLYDTSQMTIPTDRVDEEQLARPSHWDIGFIRRFMIRFGPISSVFDFATFAVMLWVLRRRRARVPLRLVRRVARHPDPHRVRRSAPGASRSSGAARRGRCSPRCSPSWPSAS